MEMKNSLCKDLKADWTQQIKGSVNKTYLLKHRKEKGNEKHQNIALKVWGTLSNGLTSM